MYQYLPLREIRRNCKNEEIIILLANEPKEWFAADSKLTLSIIKFIEKYIRDEQWSTEQIVGYCKKENIPMVSHERINQHIREDKVKGGDLYTHLRHQLKRRKPRKNLDYDKPVELFYNFINSNFAFAG